MSDKAMLTLVVVPAAIMILQGGAYAGQHAQEYEIVVDIGGTVLHSASPHQSRNIAGTYSHPTAGTITITDSGDTARVYADTSNDGTLDSLRLTNARITAGGTAVQGFPIKFWRRLIEGPVATPSSSNVYYRTNGQGSFQQTTGSTITIGGFVRDPLPDTGFLSMGSFSHTPGTLSFNKTVSTRWPKETYALDDDRDLKVEFSFNLAANRFLNLPTGITIYSSPSPGMDCREGGECEHTRELLLPAELQLSCTAVSGLMSTCATIYATTNALGCPSCVTEDSTVAPSAKLTLFARVNWESLSEDMAQGQGEYLASLAALLEVPDDQQAAFFELAQEEYAVRSGQEVITPDSMIEALRARIADSKVFAAVTKPPN
jgi:hypothetical protein